MNRLLAMSLLCALALALTVSCSEQKPEPERMSWYDETKIYNQQNRERESVLIGQGMTATQAQRETTLETYIRATERGAGVPPLQGNDLDAALRNDPYQKH